MSNHQRLLVNCTHLLPQGYSQNCFVRLTLKPPPVHWAWFTPYHRTGINPRAIHTNPAKADWATCQAALAKHPLGQPSSQIPPDGLRVPTRVSSGEFVARGRWLSADFLLQSTNDVAQKNVGNHRKVVLDMFTP